MMNEELCQGCGKMMSECECKKEESESPKEEVTTKPQEPSAQLPEMAEKAVGILKKLGLSPETVELVAKELAEVIEKGGAVAVVAVKKEEEEAKPTPSLYERLKNSKY